MNKKMKDKLVIGNFITSLFSSLCYSVIHQQLINAVGSNLISINCFITYGVGIIFPIIWNKYKGKLYNYYGFLLIAEIIIYSILNVTVISGKLDLLGYYIIDTIAFSIITQNILCGSRRLKALKYNNENLRTKFDNDCQIAINIACMVGFGISSIIEFSFNQAFVMNLIAIISDNIFYYSVWKENIKELRKVVE